MKKHALFAILLSFLALPLAADRVRDLTLEATAVGPGIPGTDVISVDGGRDSFLIAAMGSLAGAGGTFFRSDLTLVNFRTAPQDVLIYWLPRGETGSITVPVGRLTIPASAFVFYEDFVARTLQRTGLGALRVRSVETGTEVGDLNARVDGFSRIWTTIPGSTTGGTVSQPFPSVYDLDLGPTTEPGFILGMRHDAAYRSNVGIVNFQSTQRTFTINVSGTVASTSFTVTVPAQSMNQFAVPTGTYGHVLVSIVPAEVGLWSAYGSTVDNITGDGWTSKAQYASFN